MQDSEEIRFLKQEIDCENNKIDKLKEKYQHTRKIDKKRHKELGKQLYLLNLVVASKIIQMQKLSERDFKRNGTK